MLSESLWLLSLLTLFIFYAIIFMAGVKPSQLKLCARLLKSKWMENSKQNVNSSLSILSSATSFHWVIHKIHHTPVITTPFQEIKWFQCYQLFSFISVLSCHVEMKEKKSSLKQSNHFQNDCLASGTKLSRNGRSFFEKCMFAQNVNMHLEI